MKRVLEVIHLEERISKIKLVRCNGSRCRIPSQILYLSTSDQQLLFLNISEVLQVFHEGIYDYVPGFYQIRCNLEATTAVHRKSTAQIVRYGNENWDWIWTWILIEPRTQPLLHEHNIKFCYTKHVGYQIRDL